jgi:serine/threonine-protein kinase
VLGALVGELPPPHNIPPLQLLYPEVPAGIGIALDRALSPDPLKRFPSVGALLRAVDRVSGSRSVLITGAGPLADERGPTHDETEESRVRWATADDYDVLALLGRGSFGTVWRVRDLTLGREVALKVLHPSIAKDERVVTRFRREARLAAQLSHPAIVPIYDWDSRGDVSWYTMELAEGGSLAQHLARKGPRPLIEVAPQAHQILDALSAAHNIGVIHRDLKPENVLIDRWFRWRITDFGIANVTGEDLGSSGSGTPAFAAPEQLLGEPQSPAADLFAVGAIVWYALTGLPPFEGKDPKTILAQQLTGELETTLFHPAVGAWLLRALAPKVEDRFADAQDMKGAWLDAAEAAIAAEQDEGSWWSRLVRGLGARG